MSESEALLDAARRILEGAGRDLEHGFHESACVGAQRGAVMATEAWLRAQGQSHVSGSVHENVCLSPTADRGIREAALRLDRHRVEEAYPHRSSPPVSNPAGEATKVVLAGRRVLSFVERELGRG